MNRRFRTRSTAVDGYLRYLKPGALGQLRDRKINARTHCRSFDSQTSLSRTLPSSPGGSGQHPEASATNAVADGESPCLSPRFYGPRCPQRKKLMAVRSVSYSEPLDGPAPVIDASVNDLLVAR